MTDARQRETDQAREFYDRIAPRYDRLIRLPERLLFADGRRWVGARAHGDVLEIAVGTGRNLPLFARDITLTGIQLSPRMLEVARRRADEFGRAAGLRLGDAQDLPFADESFDTVVCTLSLCSIPDENRAVAEAVRVLRPGGRFILLEHVAGDNALVRGGQRLLDPIFVRFQADHLLREPAAAVQQAGLEIMERERSKLGIVERVSARKPVRR